MGNSQRFILLLSLMAFTALVLPSALYGQGNGGTMAPPDTTQTTLRRSPLRGMATTATTATMAGRTAMIRQ